MNYQDFVNTVSMPCCVLSVEQTTAGVCGEIRIIAANKAYKNTMGPGYYDGMLYYELVPQDNKFEDYCFRAAILKQRMHAYVETKALGFWTDQTLIPLESDREDLGFCQFIFEFTQQAEADRMAAVSVTTAEAVIKASLTLLRAEDFQSSVRDVLRVIMEEADAMVGQIILIDHEHKQSIDFCRVISEDVKLLYDAGAESISYELLNSWEKMIGVSNAVIIQNEQDMEQIAAVNPAWAESMCVNHVKTLVLVPLYRAKDVIGYLYVLNFDTHKVVKVKELVELMSFVLGSEIYTHMLLRKLEELSQIDTLTGIQNRRAMQNRMRNLEKHKNTPFGVVNIDLNGLKDVNDREGHEVGDKLLIQAGELLREVFCQEDLFRTGGDEFLIITSGMDEETFLKKVKRLHEDAEMNAKVSFASGEYWSEGEKDIKDVFRCADERMYADKQDFYEKNPELRRK